MIVWTIVNIVTVVLDYYVTNHFFFMCLCFIWAKKTPNSSLNLALGISIPSTYLFYKTNSLLSALCVWYLLLGGGDIRVLGAGGSGSDNKLWVLLYEDLLDIAL